MEADEYEYGTICETSRPQGVFVSEDRGKQEVFSCTSDLRLRPAPLGETCGEDYLRTRLDIAEGNGGYVESLHHLL